MKHWLWPLHEALKMTALWSTYFDHFKKHLLWPLHKAPLVLWTQNIYFRKHSHCFVKRLLWPLYEALTLTTSWSTYIDCVLWSTYFDHFMRHLITLTTSWSTYIDCVLWSTCFDHFIWHLLWLLHKALTLTVFCEALTLTTLWGTYFDHFMKHLPWPLYEALSRLHCPACCSQHHDTAVIGHNSGVFLAPLAAVAPLHLHFSRSYHTPSWPIWTPSGHCLHSIYIIFTPVNWLYIPCLVLKTRKTN